MSGKLTIAQIKEAILQVLDIPGFYGQYLNFSGKSSRIFQDSPNGWSNRHLCPIHNDKTTPAFFVNMKTGAFICQTCNARGSFIDFYMLMHQMNIKDSKQIYEAVKKLSELTGFDLDSYRKNQGDQPLTKKKISSGNPIVPAEEDWLPKVVEADEYDRFNEPIPVEVVTHFQTSLLPEHVLYLNQVRGLNRRSIEKNFIGFNPQARVKSDDGTWHDGRYTIPVPNAAKQFRNIRQYSQHAPPATKMINFVMNKKTSAEKRFGSPPRLLGIHLLQNPLVQHVVIVEGEFDYMLLNQVFEEFGYEAWAAVTGTHGAKKFLREWILPMFNRNVYWSLDCDNPGRVATTNNINAHFLKPMEHGKFTSVRDVKLPLPGTKDSKDISDYLLKSRYTVHDFVKLCTETPELIIGGIDNDEASVDSIEVDDFIAAIKDRRYIDKRITVPLTISGSSDKVYHAIRSYKVTKCDEQKDGNCCMGETPEEETIPYGHPMFIESCNEKQAAILRSIGCMACERAGNCPSVTPLKKVVMEKHMAHQVIKRWRAQEDVTGKLQNTQELAQAPIYVLQPPEKIHVQPQNYMATGWVRTDPRTSSASFFVEKLVPLEKDWKKFSISNKESYDLISSIKREFPTTKSLVEEIVNGITKIYNADEILYGVLMTYLSPIQFKFNNQMIRGWINGAIIGDSGTGKSQTYIRFSDWIETGDLFSGLTGSRTGLLYSIKPKYGEWIVSIGRYVQANGTMIAVDEAQNITAKEIGEMAYAMSDGYLEVNRVASGGYHTRTRLLLLLNPKDFAGNAATISDFPNGCEALSRCFNPMFIRRLDFAIFVASGRDYEMYNKKNQASIDSHNMRLTDKMMRALVHWAWTRSANQIIWSDEALNHCLFMAGELSKIFGDTDKVPLVNPQDFRENLARLSVAYSILDRNFTEDLECVRVEKKHVEFVSRYLTLIYSSSACNLRQFSKNNREKNNIEDYDLIKESIEHAIDQEKCHPNPEIGQCLPFLQMLIAIWKLGTVQNMQLSDQLNVNRQWINKKLLMLQGLSLVQPSRYGSQCTRRFNMFMQRWTSSEEVEKMIEAAKKASGRLSSTTAIEELGTYESRFRSGF